MIRRVALFPTQSGQLTIDPLTVICDVEIPSRGRSWLFDDFFSDPFSRRRATRDVTSQPVEVTVLPLPAEGKPPMYSGAVGSYKISARVDAAEVTANDAITYSIKIEGTGNIKGITLPNMNFPPEVDVFDPEISQRVRTTRGIRGGFIKYDFVLIPRKEGRITLEPVAFSYFDPKAERYRTIATKAIGLEVARGEESPIASASGLSKEEIALLSSDVRFIKRADLSLRKAGSRFYASGWAIVWAVSPLFMLAGAVWYRAYEEKLSKNVAYSRRRRAASTARRRLRRATGEVGDDPEFWSTLAKAVTGYVADRLNLPEAIASPEEIRAALKGHGVPSEIIERCGNFLDACDLQRFSPTGEGSVDMSAADEDAADLVAILREHV